MTATDWIVLQRDCEAVQIPYGNPITLRGGAQVRITQQLGGTFTVETDTGFLARIEGVDGDALGLDATAASAPASDEPFSEQQVWDVLRSCYDPEIPINIVDLGLIYACDITASAGGKHDVRVQMTLTAPGCGMGDYLKSDIEQRLSALPGVASAIVDVVFDPPWDASRMSEAARLEAGLM